MKTIRILATGDVVGKPGRQACMDIIPKLRKSEALDMVIANGENMANGSGITEATVQDLFDHGVDVITTGDHVFKKRTGDQILHENHRVIRPANYPARAPGEGSTVFETRSGVKVGVINLIGRVFLKTVDCPFQTAERLVDKIRPVTPVILVDLHAEATSEKVAMGWFLNGKVSAVYGTHTHIQTADEGILSEGTAYMTDLGMCGPYKSVIGRDVDQVLEMFLSQISSRLEVATEDARLSGAIFEIDAETGKAVSVKRVHERLVYA